MSIRTLNGLGNNTNLYVNNMFGEGEAIEIIQTSNTTQAEVNLNMKKNTTEETTPNSNDLILISDNSTGKIIKYMTYANFISGVNYTGTTPISVNNTTNTISIDTIPVNKGGSGQTTFTDGQLLIGNTSGNTLTKATLTAGSGISIVNGNGSITISYDGTEGQFTLSGQSLYPILASTNLIVGATSGSALYKFSVTGNSFFNGDIYVNNIHIDNNDYLQFSELNLNGSNYIRLKGQDSLTSNFTLNLPAKTGTIATEYSGTSPVSVNNTTNVISLNTIPVASGGSGQTTFTDGQLLIGNTSGNTLTKATLTAGSGISITNGNGSISIGATGVGNWTLNSGLLYPNSALTKVAIGGTTINSGFEFQNHGNFYNTGNITTVSFESGAVVLRDVNNSGIRFDYYNGSSYDVGPLIKPDIIGTKEYIHINSSFMTGASGAGERMVIQSYLHNGANTTIEVQSQTSANTIKLPTTTGTLALTTDIIPSNWTLNSGLLYPNATATNVLLGKTTAVDSSYYKLEMLGNAYIDGNMVFNNYSEISGVKDLTFVDIDRTNTITLSSGNVNLTSNIDIQLPAQSGALFTTNMVLGASAGGTGQNVLTFLEGYILRVNAAGDGYDLNKNAFDNDAGSGLINYQFTSDLMYLKRTGTNPNNVLRLAGQQSVSGGYDSSARIEFYARENGNTTGVDKGCFIEYNNPTNMISIGNKGLSVFNPTTYVGTAVPLDGLCMLYLDPPNSTSTTNKYVSIIRYGSPEPTSDKNFTKWCYVDTSSSREFLGYSYCDGGGTGTDIYSLEKDGDLNILGALSESDSRVKTNIVNADLDECIDVLKSINLKKYNYTEDYIYSYNKTTEKVFGFLADDIIDNEYLGYCGKIKGMPKILNKANGETETLNDFKTIRKSEILSVLWGVCRKQQDEIETLKDELESIKIMLLNNNII